MIMVAKSQRINLSYIVRQTNGALSMKFETSAFEKYLKSQKTPAGIFIPKGSRFLLAVTACSLMALASCVTSGREFPSSFVWVSKNKTQQKDVKMVLGDPQFVGSNDGQPMWTFGYYKYRLFSPSYTKEVKFYWNADNSVQSYSFNSSFPDDIEGVTPLPARPASDVRR
jgi:hypothetical protein